MSTNLTTEDFPTTANRGPFSWLFDYARPRLRDAAKTVRTEAAWQTWPTIHRIAKSLQERLTTDQDIALDRQGELHAMAARCAKFYPTEAHLRLDQGDDRLQEIALTIGGGLDDGNTNLHGITLDEVLTLYRAEYATTNTPATTHTHDPV